MAVHQIGDLRHEFKQDMIKTFDRILNENEDKDSYYLYYHTTNFGNEFVTKVMILNGELSDEYIKKLKVLATMMFHVDNRKSKIDMLWNLPYDLVVTSTINQEEEICEFISNDVKDSNINIIF